MRTSGSSLGVALLALTLAGCGGGGGRSTSAARATGPVGGAPVGSATTPGGTAPGTTANGAPVIASAPPLTATVGKPWTYTLAVSDPDGDALTLAFVSGPAGAALDPLTRTVTWTPTAPGATPFTLTASDATHTTPQSFTVNVTAGGIAPGAGSGGTSTARGTFTRTIQTQAQTGLPSISVAYKVFVPSGYVVTQPIPLVVSELTPLDRWSSIAEGKTFMVVEQQGYKGTGAWTFDYDVLAFDAILTDVQATWNVDTTRVHLTGFSAGAHWTYAIGLANADQFAGLGISAGAMAAAAIPQGVWPGAVKRKIAVAIRHGTNDTIVPVAQGRADRDRLKAAGHPVDFAEFAGGHTVETAELAQIWAFLEDKRRP